MLRIHRTIYALIPLLTAGILSLTVIQPVSAKVTPKPASVKVIVVKNDITMSGLDLHDGTINYVNGMFYMYGTMYACGFTWGTHNTPFCGFGVSTAPSITGPWTTPTLLFSPTATVDTTGGNWAVDNGQTWNWVCGSDGAGCFNPRMVQRASDGVWILWFNAPGDYVRTRANAYWAMGCNGPAGPCGASAGAPHGTDHKPSLTPCGVDGDFSIISSGTSASILCSEGDLDQEALDKYWVNGTGVGSQKLAGIPAAEGVGAFNTGTSWEMIYSLPGCGYCSGPPSLLTAGGATEVQAGYATSPSMSGPWTAQGVLSASYCTGQPRTVFTVNGATYEWVDEWTGSRNETAAKILLEPMSASPWSCVDSG